MKLVMTLLVRDEEDILDWNLRYHLSRGIDHFVVTDNLSVDGTAGILHRHRQRGHLTYLRETSDDYSQDLWVTRMANIAQSELHADWVLHCDADEFWWPGGADDLRQAFAAVPLRRRVVSARRHNFAGPPTDTSGPFFDRMVYRRRAPRWFARAPLPKVAHRPLRRPYVHQGNHAVSEDGRRLKAKPLAGVSILHFPARSPEQLRAKVEKGGAAYARNTRLGPQVGSTWREMYHAWRAGQFDRVLAANFMVPGEAGARSYQEDHRLRDYLSSLS